MKKWIAFFLAFALCLGLAVTAYAEEDEMDGSTPRLMVTSYELDKDFVTPGESATLTVNIKNFSSSKAVKNIKLSINGSDDIVVDGMGTQYVSAIYVGSTYTWEIPVTAAKTAQDGEHSLTVSMEYEDKYYMSYSASDELKLTVKQTVALDFDGAILPAKVIQESTETVSVNLMNTGKSNLRNCKIDFDIEGLESGGTTFVGEIYAGESAVGSANLRVSSTMLGETAGTIRISYEDEFGESYSKTVEVSTTIAEKIVVNNTQSEEEEQAKYPLWWLFGLIGLAVGGGIGCAIPLSIISFKKRREYEKTL